MQEQTWQALSTFTQYFIFHVNLERVEVRVEAHSFTKGGSYSTGDGARNKVPAVHTGLSLCVRARMLSLTVSPTHGHFSIHPVRRYWLPCDSSQ